MIRYFEVDESIVCQAEHWPFLLDCFGFGRGRLIAKPEFDVAKHTAEMSGLSIDSRLQDCFSRPTVTPTLRLSMEGTPPSIPFLNRSRDERWDVEYATEVSRVPAEVAALICPAMCCEPKITVIDQYFRADDGRGFAKTLQAVLDGIATLSCARQVVIHTKGSHSKKAFGDAALEKSRAVGASIYAAMHVVPGCTLDVYCWPKDMEDFHNRYILGESGGIGLCWGLDSDDKNHDVLFLLHRKLSEQIRRRFESTDRFKSVKYPS